MALFENYERRIDKINGVLAQYGISSVEECREICKAKGFDPYEIVKGIQPICFENACWAYTVGAAIAIKSGVKSAAEAAKMIGVGLQSFCIDGSVAEDRKVGLGHGNLGAMLLSDESKCFAFLAGHESFAAAEGAIGIVRNANKARKEPLRVILNGLGKDAAQIISRINGFTYVQTQFDYFTGKLNIVREIRYSETERADVRCYGADDVREGVAIMHSEGVDVCRPRLLRHDRHHGPHALRCPVRRLILRARARGNDGLPRHGQQPHGRCHRRRGRRCCGEPQVRGKTAGFVLPRFQNLIFHQT